MIATQRKNGRVKKSYVINEKLADRVSHDAINLRKLERDIIEDALQHYYKHKKGKLPLAS